MSLTSRIEMCIYINKWKYVSSLSNYYLFHSSFIHSSHSTSYLSSSSSSYIRTQTKNTIFFSFSLPIYNLKYKLKIPKSWKIYRQFISSSTQLPQVSPGLDCDVCEHSFPLTVSNKQWWFSSLCGLIWRSCQQDFFCMWKF